jgi:ribosomal protein S18 acetylase RimI-like enzyme
MMKCLRPLDEKQISLIASIHQLAFPESAWTRMGQRVVEEYYLWHLLGPHPHVRASGVFFEDECAAFCVSGVFNGSTSGFLKNNQKLFAIQLAKKPWLLLDPIFVGKLRSGLNILKRFSKIKSNDKKEESVPEREPSFGILAIAVHPRHQGARIGQLLMEDAEKAAIDLDYKKMDLTVNPTNKNAIRFYERQNWKRHLENDTWKGVMVKDLRG